MKPLFTFICIILVLSVLAVPAAATNSLSDKDEGVLMSAEGAPDGDTENEHGSAGDNAPTEVEVLPDSVGTENVGTENDGTENVGTENFFELIYLEIGKYTSEIFCAASLIGTLVLSLLYKKGLLPMLKAGISSLAGTVRSIKENEEKYTDELLSGKDALIAGLEKTDSVLSALAEKIGKLECDLNAIKNIERREAALELILGTQVDALTEIFMSSSLPEYQKAALSERIRSMREALGNVRQEANH